QIACDAKMVLQRTLRGKAQAKRAAMLENDLISSQEKSDEILRRQFENFINQKGVSEDLQKALKKQQELYSTIINDKKAIINELLQALKLQDDNYASTLRKNAEEVNVMIARMEDQIKLMTKVYREELAQIEVGPSSDRSSFEWFGERPRERTEKNPEQQLTPEDEKTLVLGKGRNTSYHIQKYQRQDHQVAQLLSHAETYVAPAAIHRLVCVSREAREIEKLKNIYIDHQKKFAKQSIALTDYSHYTQKHFAITDAKHFEEVWLMIEEEVKHLAQRALAIDSVISQQLYGSPEQQTDLNLLLLSSPFRPWKTRTEIVQTQFPPVESPAESSIEILDTTESTEEELAFINSSPEWEGEKLDEETQEELRELLLWLAHARDSSGDEAYWNSLGNIIAEERVKLWDSTLRTLKKHVSVTKNFAGMCFCVF
uniref:Dynein regulatory complex protein 1/2 N-terminal domain-containing protein n=1 Tax=Poecilia reticulata TaxID=8081 RepID=A0A3P9P0D0_POERE